MPLKSRLGHQGPNQSNFRILLFVVLVIAALAPSRSVAAQELIAATKHPDTKTEPQQQPQLNRILLLLNPTTKQQAQLDKLLAAQTSPANPLFHKWLTPAEFTSRFAPSNESAATVATWLRAQGFSVAKLPETRGWIEFSGTANQFKQAFGAKPVAISNPSVATPTYKLQNPASFPASIASLVEGFVSLDGVEATAASTPPIASSDTVASALTVNTADQPVTPARIFSQLHFSSTPSQSGAGETIAFPSRTTVRTEDFNAFRATFNLPTSQLAVHLSGPDPGQTVDEAATIQAISWAGAAAPATTILLVPAASTDATDGLDLALAATIDGALAHTVSIGYTSCESAMSPAHQAFYATLYRQAAAEGISIIAASGDSGAAACHQPSETSAIEQGLGVNALASTPWNTAVGAIALSSAALSELSPSASPVKPSFLEAWQSTSSSTSIYATGGGTSKLYHTPTWQTVPGTLATNSSSAVSSENTATAPVEHHRYLPDISLPTAASSTSAPGLAFCFSGQSLANPPAATCSLVSSEGSAVSAAIFAGISAVLAETYGPQGNLAPNLYALDRHPSAAVFNDVLTGNAKLPCVAESPDCTNQEIGFDTAPGYDLASGLGSINAAALIAKWASPQDLGDDPVTVEMTTVGGVTYNPSATVILTAKVLSGSGGDVPTGTVQFYDETVGANTGDPVTLSAAGIATYSESGQFTNGGHNIVAIYSGDTTYEPLTSQPITINIQPSATAMTVTPSTITPASGSIITVTGVVTSTNPGATPPTGLITVNLDGIAQGTGTLTTTGTTTSAKVSVTIPSGGAHTVQGTYSGDTNYDNSTSPSVTVTVAQTASVTTLSATPSTITTGVPETFTATVAPATPVTGTAAVLTGTVAFYDGTKLLSIQPVSGNTAILTGITLAATASHTITAVYSGDSTYSTSTSAPLVVASTLAPVTVSLTASTAILSPGQAVTLTAVVTPVNIPPLTAEQNPSGFVLFYAGKVLIGTQAPVLQSTGDSGIASTFVSSLPAGQYVITAVYSGDPTYAGATSNSLNLRVEDFTVACNSAAISMVQGTTQAVTCSVASLGGLNGPIQVVCEEQNPPTLGAITCTFSPSIVNGTGPTTLSVVTTAGNISENLQPGALPPRRSPPWEAASGGIALAFAGLLLSPIGRRARKLRPTRLLALTLLLTGMAITGIGCSNTVTLNTNTGTPLGEHTLKITAAADVNAVTVSHYTYLTVNVTP